METPERSNDFNGFLLENQEEYETAAANENKHNMRSYQETHHPSTNDPSHSGYPVFAKLMLCII
jgi:hypothetical protein